MSNDEASGSSVEPDALPFLAELKGITKRFPGVVALDEVDFDLRAGEVHVLFGENGAGKSTLINIIAGTYPPDQGRFYFEGREVAHQSPYSARRAGISPVFQEFSLAPNLSVEENLFLGREQVRLGVLDKTRMHAEACEMLADLGFDLDANAIVGELMRAQQQMVEIAKALLQDVKLLILDEPTSSLTERETTRLFELIDRLKRERVGILYVSHRMGEIKQVGDRLTVLRDGKKIGTVEAAEVEETQLVEMMTGRTFDVLFPEIDHRPAEVLLEVKNLTLASGRLDDVSFSVHAGEIVGVAGLVGCGKSELARAVYGLEDIAAGEIVLEGAHISQPTPAMMLGRALTYFPSDRLAEGLSLPRPIRENISMAALDLPAFARFRWLRRARERVEVGEVGKGAPDPPTTNGAKDRLPFGRQPTKGHARARAHAQYTRVPVRRTDGRHRRRSEERGLRADEEPCGVGCSSSVDFIGTPGGSEPRQPSVRDASGSDRRRTRYRRLDRASGAVPVLRARQCGRKLS